MVQHTQGGRQAGNVLLNKSLPFDRLSCVVILEGNV